MREIVEACTDSWEGKGDWRGRKERYVAHIELVPAPAVLVSLADKVHNARSICADLRTSGDIVFDRFKGKRDGTLWYYESLASAFQKHHDGVPLAAELQRVVAEMKGLA